jgi:hypothetical protein
MKILSVSWNPNIDETNIKLTEEFISSDWTVRADVLKDILIEITELYEAVKNEEKNSIIIDVLGHSENESKLESVK